ncbi:MAG: type IV pilin protein [Microcystaceae cyanobacterium]
MFSSKRFTPSPRPLPNQGFTLIELLVVVIIIGVLSAIAIPAVMSQIGKAREGEAKSLIGALNRAQQAYFSENGEFAVSSDPSVDLEIPTGQEKYYNVVGIVPNVGVQYVHNDDNDSNNTRDYVGAVQYNTVDRSFSAIVCRINKGIEVSSLTAVTHVSSYGEVDTVIGPLVCNATARSLK